MLGGLEKFWDNAEWLRRGSEAAGSCGEQCGTVVSNGDLQEYVRSCRKIYIASGASSNYKQFWRAAGSWKAKGNFGGCKDLLPMDS